MAKKRRWRIFRELAQRQATRSKGEHVMACTCLGGLENGDNQLARSKECNICACDGNVLVTLESVCRIMAYSAWELC